MQLPTAVAAATGPRDPTRPSPTRRLRGSDERRSAEPTAPSAPLSGSSRRLPQRAGSRLAFVLASSFAPDDARSFPGGSAPLPTPGLRRAPRAARRYCRVSSSGGGGSGGGGARSHISRPRSGRRQGSGRPERVYGRARRPGRGASPSGPAAPCSPPLALQASPASRAPARPRRPLSPLPAGSPGLPRAATFLGPSVPGARPGPRGAKGAGPSPPAASAPLPLDARAASAHTSLRVAGLGASCTSGTRVGEARGVRGEDGRDCQTWPVGPSRGRCGRAGRMQLGEGRLWRLQRRPSCSPSATPKDMRVPRGAAEEEEDPLRSSRLDSS